LKERKLDILTTREQQLEKEIADKNGVLNDASGFVKDRLTGVEKQIDGLALRIAGEMNGHTVVIDARDREKVEHLTVQLQETQKQLDEASRAKDALAQKHEAESVDYMNNTNASCKTLKRHSKQNSRPRLIV